MLIVKHRLLAFNSLIELSEIYKKHIVQSAEESIDITRATRTILYLKLA